MAQEELSSNTEEINTEELLEAFNELYTKYKTLKSKSNQHINSLTKENEMLVNEREKLIFEKEELDLKNTELNMSLEHMKYKIKNLEKILLL